ncbi:MAG TPA: ThuA domain-containing protein [Kofleriaceae bacterium]|nr:ThuA domain-containing protein [Kofleriaceae bacterium]
MRGGCRPRRSRDATFASLVALGVCAACGACAGWGDDVEPPAPRVLAYSRTLGYRHETIATAQAALTARLADDGVVVETTEDPLRFRAEELATFDGVVFLYTTGNDVLDADGKAAFEAFVRGGGGWAGVHSAADTEFEWPFYAELVVAYFDSHPVPQPATVHVDDAAHPATAGAPEPWMATDEWYNFRANARDTGGVRVLLTIDEATYAGGNMGADHPLAWAHERAGGRAFYTALGHVEDRWSDPVFVDHVAGGVRWTLHRE